MSDLGGKIDHFVVLMLENRSFDCMLGGLKLPGVDLNGLTGREFNSYTPPQGPVQRVPCRSDPSLEPGAMTIPKPDPGELFVDMNTQLFGLNGTPNSLPPPMNGFVDSYMRQPPAEWPYDLNAPMHYYTSDQVPVLSELARSFAVSDQWHASAPCQTWPNRFFVHRATAGGYVNNTAAAIACPSPSIFHRLESVGRTSRVYFHDMPQSITLADQWPVAADRFRLIEDFWDDADHGDLPDYSFIEPRYFTDAVLGLLPNDQHPPHDIVYGEQLMARVYNAVRSSPAWRRTLLVITFDEHGGCYDHVPPPPAVPPEPAPGHDGFLFDRYGVRVPAVIISPYVAAGTVLRNPGLGDVPFDHTSIIRTLRERFDPTGAPLTGRDAGAPSLDLVLNLDQPSNDGPDQIEVPSYTPTAEELQQAKDLPANDLQRSLCELSVRLPAPGSDVMQHLEALRDNLVEDATPVQLCVADAASLVRENLNAFLGKL
jgi:phospholipase C